MSFEFDFSSYIEKFSEEITLYRYPVEIDDNGHRIIDTENPTQYTLVGSIQQLDQEVEWIEEGTNLAETRVLFLPYPYKLSDGSEVGIQIRTRVSSKEDVPVDGIQYRGSNYDLVQKLADYPQYGYEQYVLERVE